MMRLLSAEWLKMRKRWMPRILMIVLLVLLALIFWGVATSRTSRIDVLMPRAWVTSLVLSALIASFLWPILAGSWAGGEYGWGTIRMLLSRNPGRTQFVLVGICIVLIAIGIALVAALLLGTVAGVVVAELTGNHIFYTNSLDVSFWGILAKTFFAAWFALAFYAVLAYAAGTVFRSSAVGIGVGIGIILAEHIVGGIFNALGGSWQEVSRHFPSTYTDALTSRVAAGALTKDMTSIGSSTPGVVTSMIAIAIYIAVPLALTIIFVRRRDVTA